MDEERLIVMLEGRVAEFEKRFKRAERTGTKTYTGLRRGSKVATTAMERDMVRSSTRINQALATTSSRIGMVGKAFAATAIATGMAAITTGATRAVRGMAQLDAQAKRAGLSVTAFQQLKFVGEQNLIDVDQMVDGLKELQLRADEFVQTGGGPAAEAFNRIGLDARQLKRALEEPEELFLDIIDRMEDLDRAGQIRVADEVFGGSAGERFVELLDQGDEGIRDMMNRAEELGLVLDESAIAKAAELDRKFGEISARVSTLAKTIVVELAGSLEEALTIDVDDIFGSAERAIAMMGEANYRAMSDANNITKDQTASVEDLIDTYEDLFRKIAAATGPDGIRLMDVADLDTAHELSAILTDIDREMVAFQNGKKSAAEFEAEVAELVEEAQDLLGELSEVDAARFGNVIGAISGIATALADATRNAASLRSALPAGDTETSVAYGPQNGRGSVRYGSEIAYRTPGTRPVLPSINASFGSPENTSSGGSSGGGSARQDLNDFQQEIENTREQIAQLEFEAVALVAAAEGGREFGDALEYARKRAELLYAAQEAGRAITPELAAEIDNLAISYATAGEAADSAADNLQKMADHAELGADRMTDLFMGIIDGSMSAKDAIIGLLMEIAKVNLRNAMMDIAGAGIGGGGGGGGGLLSGIFGFVGKLLSGGRATGGPVNAGEAYLVNERTPNSEVFVPGQSGAVLNVPQAQAALRGASGSSGGSTVVNVPVSITNTVRGAQVDARRAPDGSLQIEVFEAMKDAVSSGRLDKPMRQRFGIAPQPQGL